jgi:tRNA nucleotidyltransferase (CCA-adding enzyme)
MILSISYERLCVLDLLDNSLQKKLETIINRYPLLPAIIKTISQKGGRALLVGGAVRDLLLDLPVSDLDIEVYHLSLPELEHILKEFGVVRLVGKAFGVLRVDGIDIDWALPRADSAGRKPEVALNPDMLFKQAFARRDLTINAMAIDLVTYQLIDEYNGLPDLKNNVLRATDPKLFVEDPLRFFRVMHFVGRFAMQPDNALNQLCQSMDIAGVSRERIEKEFEKLLLLSESPSLGIRWLHSITRLQNILPELYALVGVPQRPDYHPEGDVFEHTMQALDAAVPLSSSLQGENQKLTLLYAALCHDLGKASTTVLINGVWRSQGHAQAGVPLARHLLDRLVCKASIIKTVAKLVYHHMAIGEFVRGGARLCRYKQLAYRLCPETNLHMLSLLSMADRRGRNGHSHQPLTADDTEVVAFVQKAEQAGVLCEPEAPVLTGADLLELVEPGPQIGRLLERAYAIQLEHAIVDKKELLKRIL